MLVLLDDMGYSDPGCYGGDIETPNIDRLANKGVRFAQFYNTGRLSVARLSVVGLSVARLSVVGLSVWSFECVGRLGVWV